MISPTSASERTERLAAELRTEGVDAFFGWSPVTIGYLAGFREGAGERFLAFGVRSDGSSALIAPALSESQARRAGIRDIRPWRDGADPLALFRGLADEWSLRSAVLAVDDEMPAAQLLAMQDALPAALYKPGGEILARLMRCKDARELQAMQAAAAIADEAFASGVGALREGCAEIDVSHALSQAMRRLGGNPAFAIVAFGPNGAEPHHLSDSTALKRGDVVVMDFGCEFGGYHSDITRVVAFGEPDPEASDVYGVVYEAQAAARRLIAPGVPAEDVDAEARRVIAEAGYDDFFVHRLGHGIGMRVHEAPNLVEGNKYRLEPGNCFSVEPGIYLPGRFGVRIENIVTVEPGGHRSFNAEPSPSLIVVS